MQAPSLWAGLWGPMGGAEAGRGRAAQAPSRHACTADAAPSPSLLIFPSAVLQGLTKLLADNAPGCMKEQKFDNYFGRKIAVDASMHIYAFMARPACLSGPGCKGHLACMRGHAFLLICRLRRFDAALPPPRRLWWAGRGTRR